MLYIFASRVPLLNWYSFSAPGILQTRITVPLSDALASIVPVELMARYEIGDLCAWMTLTTVLVRVEKRTTSPVCGVLLDEGVRLPPGWTNVAGDGTGVEYARYELSEDGESATIAVNENELW